MTVIRRPAVRRNKPVAKTEAGDVLAQAGAAVSVASESGDADDALRQEMIDEFQASLQGQQDIGAEDLEAILDAFGEAVKSAPLTAELKPFEAHDLTQTLDALVQNGMLDEDDRSVLGRKLEDALAPLNTPEVRLATEYVARCERDGEQAALEWYESERRKLKKNAEPSSGAPQDQSGFVAHDSITSLKSRRLRGPPRR